MEKHANIPHEIVWGIRRSMEDACSIVKELKEKLEESGENEDPRQLKTKLFPIMEKLANVRPDLEMLANFIEEEVYGYINSRFAAEDTMTCEEVIVNLSRYERDLKDVIERLADFKEGRYSE